MAALPDQVVLGLERSTGHGRVSEEQPVQVQDQAGIQRAPVLLEQVVLGIAVACQFLFAPVAQRRRPPVDDPLGAVSVRDDNTFYRGRCGDALDTSPISEPGEQPWHLIAVERLRATAEVDRAEPGYDSGRHPPDEFVQIGETPQETS